VSHPFTGHTVETARRTLTARFRTNAIDSAELDARILVGAALGLDLTGLITAATRTLTAAEAARLEDLACRRLTGEPVARILGAKEFWGLPLRLSAATLVPRPDTETVVELALEMLRAGPAPDRPLRIADIGTGSGAILLALLSALPDAYGIGTDISAAALSGSFDLIVSNPPYIRSAEIIHLATEVRDHDPLGALDGGSDGLDAYRALVPQAARLLGPGGVLVVEVGHDQSAEVERFMMAAGLMLERPPKADLSGTARAVGGRKLPS